MEIAINATIITLHTGTIHSTINLDEADPECDLNYAFNHYIWRKVQPGVY